jgi:hypothetical protein
MFVRKRQPGLVIGQINLGNDFTRLLIDRSENRAGPRASTTFASEQ